MQEYSESFYKSTIWQSCRESYIKSVGGLCERCYKKGIYTPGKIVHHKKYITPENIGDPNITLNFKNLELLCINCHNEEHISKHKRRYYVDKLGHVIIKPDA